MKQMLYTHTLDNGIRIAVEEMQQVRSVSFGLWLHNGSRHETEATAGMSHFIEHLLFKGSAKSSCEELAQKIDLLGGNLDAFTSKEKTSFIAKVKDTDFRAAMGLLAEIVRQPLFSESDVAMERDVVLEEIKMVMDTPDDLVHEHFHEHVYQNHTLGRSILGSPDTVARFDVDKVRDFYHARYRPERMVFTAAGNIRTTEVVAAVQEMFGDLAPAGPLENDIPPKFQPGIRFEKRSSLEQVQLLFGVETFPAVDDRRHALEVLNTCLGGSMSSRLFQSVRERLGLAYNISSFTTGYSDAGFLSVYAATSPERVDALVKAVRNELLAMASGEIEEKDITRVKSMIQADVILGMESSSNRMALLARQLMYFGKIRPLDELIADFEAVTTNDVRALASEILRNAQPAGSVIGNLDASSIDVSPLTV